MPDIFKRTCRVCGCWEMQACEGGCYWVGDDLCSACVVRADDGQLTVLPKIPTALGATNPTPEQLAEIQHYFDDYNAVLKRAGVTGREHYRSSRR